MRLFIPENINVTRSDGLIVIKQWIFYDLGIGCTKIHPCQKNASISIVFIVCLRPRPQFIKIILRVRTICSGGWVTICHLLFAISVDVPR